MATANDLDVLDATIIIPRIGPWTARVVVATETDKLSGQVLIVEGGASFLGTTRRARAFAGRTEAFIIGGAGKLPTLLPAKYYLDAKVILPLSEIAGSVGESLSATIDDAIESTVLAKWTRVAGPASHALGELVDSIGAVWRVLPDGSIWVGTETWPTVDPKGEVLDENGALGWVTFAPDRLELRPGVVWLERRVSQVIHRITPKMLRTEVLFESESDTRARGGRAALEALIDRRTSHTKFHGLYAVQAITPDPAKDGFTDARPDDPTLPEFTDVPIRAGLPGLNVIGALGSKRALIGFENGDQEKPAVVGWEAGGSLKFGTLLVTVAGPTAGVPGILLNVQLFEPSPAGDALLAAALAAIAASAGAQVAIPPDGLPITTSTVKVS